MTVNCAQLEELAAELALGTVSGAERAAEAVRAAFELGEEPPPERPLLLDVID